MQALRVLVDGRPLPDNQGRSTKDKDEWTLPLPPGKHRVAVLARRADASGISDELEIDSRPLKDKPVMHVLAIGVNHYQDKDLNLNCAATDATLLAKTFERTCKGDLFADVRTQTLLNEKATAKAILRAIRRSGPTRPAR